MTGKLSETPTRIADSTGGGALMAASLLTIFAMAHHPTSFGGGVGAYVHGAMLLCMTALLFGFARFSMQAELSRAPVLAALIFYAAGAAANAAAGAINGFIMPALHARGDIISRDVFLLGWEANQALATLAVYATGASYVLWSADLLRSDPAPSRLLGAAGLVAGAAPVALLAGGALTMDVAGAFAIYGIHAAWAFAVGVRMATAKK